GRDPDLVQLPVVPRHLDTAAQSRRGEGHRRAAEQGRAVALEARIAREMEENVDVARRAAASPRLAYAGQGDEGAFDAAGGDVHGQRLALLDPAFAPAGRTGIGDRLAHAAAGRAGLLDHEEAVARAHLAVAAAHLAGLRASARLRARSRTGIAGRGRVHL